MNKDHVKGEAEKLKGKVNEAVGKMRGDTAQELKGDLQQGAGEARKRVGDVKDALRHDTDRTGKI
ncbi:CsbD family protein [Pararobbsia silviterrae]|uniref:CsbD family protein n=1 Tax=Pararobbsia silviterrae TaxID=1792498 RepID=A0A494XZ10_9BURK|nr:CsbD family protein [Pararobbsia silviterrae]RKP55752.1 CsbD family protein [Pararobbsia silviterrae]